MELRSNKRQTKTSRQWPSWTFEPQNIILCYAIVLPGRTSGFRAGFRPVSGWESTNIGPLAGRMPSGFEVFPIRIRPTSGPEATEPALSKTRAGPEHGAGPALST